jgi:hypothetical protein
LLGRHAAGNLGLPRTDQDGRRRIEGGSARASRSGRAMARRSGGKGDGSSRREGRGAGQREGAWPARRRLRPASGWKAPPARLSSRANTLFFFLGSLTLTLTDMPKSPVRQAISFFWHPPHVAANEPRRQDTTSHRLLGELKWIRWTMPHYAGWILLLLLLLSSGRS